MPDLQERTIINGTQTFSLHLIYSNRTSPTHQQSCDAQNLIREELIKEQKIGENCRDARHAAAVTVKQKQSCKGICHQCDNLDNNTYGV